MRASGRERARGRLAETELAPRGAGSMARRAWALLCAAAVAADALCEAGRESRDGGSARGSMRALQKANDDLGEVLGAEQGAELIGSDIKAAEPAQLIAPESKIDVTALREGEVLSACFAVSECVACVTARGKPAEPACQASGFRQISVCTAKINRTVNTKGELCEGPDCAVTESAREARVYTTCVPKRSDEADDVRSFETVMLLGAAASIWAVRQRKKQAYQRLSNSLR